MPKKGVVPPQLRRYLFRKGHRARARSASARTHKRAHTRAGGYSMARYRRSRRRGGFGGMGGIKSLAKNVFTGAGVGYITGSSLIGAIGGLMLAGVPGGLGGYFAPTIKNTIGGVTGGAGVSGGNLYG